MKRTIASALIVLLLVCSFIMCLSLGASAESLYIRKIVSVVYDDSGSMSGSKEQNANYAMQAFCGMLNSEDQLYITYMSHSLTTQNYDPPKMDLSASGIQGSIESIINHKPTGTSTPYEAVEIAYNKLKSVNDPNPNTQYWLVVITDGVFNTGESKEQLNSNFSQYASQTMPNGTKPQITFMGIGNSVISPDSDEANGIYTYSANKPSEIIDVMSSMAHRISGRTRLSAKDLEQVNENTIRISSAIPLLNIAVLSQGTDAAMIEAEYEDGEDIPITRKVVLNYPKNAEFVGGAYLIGDSRKSIDSGTYKIRFNKAVSLDDVVILFEPALETRFVITVNGKALSDLSMLQSTMEGDKISVVCKIYEMGTDREIAPELLPQDTSFEITIKENGQIAEQIGGKTLTLDSYTLKNLKTEITASIFIKGFNPINSSVVFTPAKYVHKTVYTMSADFGSETQSVKLEDIATNKDLRIEFSVFADGVQITDPDEIRALNPQVSASPHGNSGSVEITSDGKIVFTPTTASVPSPEGEYFDVTVVCSIAEASVSETYRVITHKTVYTVSADFGSETQSVKLEDIATNKDLRIEFSVFADGVQITDPDEIRALNPQVSASPFGNSGSVEITSDGKIVFTPNAAGSASAQDGYIDVKVECAVAGVTASHTYRILISKYEVIVIGATDSIKKTEFFNNNTSVSFYVTKDGVQLDKSAVENLFTITLDEEHSHLKIKTVIHENGIVECAPYDDNEYDPTWFWSNWSYWGLEGSDVTLTFNHVYGTKSADIDVVGADGAYIWRNVILPFLLQLLIIALIIAYIVRLITKPKFAKNAFLYMGTLTYSKKLGGHLIYLRKVVLKRYNKIGVLLWPFSRVCFKNKGVKVYADKASSVRVVTRSKTPWSSGLISTLDPTLDIRSPKSVAEYCTSTNQELPIEEIQFTPIKKPNGVLDAPSGYCLLDVDIQTVSGLMGKEEKISSATVIYYSTK